ncbi:TetR/AcrR family transcriptional regulator [Umezawaea sp. Da 62-37]|uniref:TetR/AcrR family transcriptional regulator n=1 Tax=Umezawaea sp. Da 62-37 TaxID=3075927 RepID=UPI0028F6EBC3|nr:TetR/AcrR family transcriptional regulator [Umezawaea sp. Da 62-37]WNV87339.1 TetR/AcrR family transcriptional regulator [Umezawaea sp. Da 62-37]
MPPRAYNAANRRSAADRNRAAILRACGELLPVEGYQATTVRAVAIRAGVSPETVHKVFGGKRGLVKALWDVTLAGDDEPVPMSRRPALREVLSTQDPNGKLRLYATFARDVQARLAPLFSLLGAAGPEVAEVLAEAERERLTGVTAFLAHLADTGLLRPGVDPVRQADVCWVLTGPQLYTQLTAIRGWDPDTYRDWLAEALVDALLP